MFGLPDNGPVPAKWVTVKFFDGLYDVRPQGIKVYVAGQGKQIVVFVAEYGFVAVLEQMSAALMTAVVVLGIPREEFSHDGGDAVVTGNIKLYQKW
jgi:phosphoribosylcarboxyaminoimidazole (NCAIR) mutase